MVRLEIVDDTLSLAISDNGVGFDVEHSRPGGNGLANIRNRMGSVGGRAEIVSAPGAGTTTTLLMPLHAVIRNGKPH
jgi:signal transduction histidine kinase